MDAYSRLLSWGALMPWPLPQSRYFNFRRVSAKLPRAHMS